MPMTTFEEEPQFTYKPPTEEEQQAFKAYQAKMSAAAALVSEARAHQWEHKQPAARLATGVGPYQMDAGAERPTVRTFTREEVLTVLKALGAELKVHGIHSAGLLAIDRARAIFENME